MTQNEKVLAAFEGRVRQLILRFQELKKENEELYVMVSKNEEEIKTLQDKLSRSEQDYNALKMARMVEITDGDLQGAKDRLGGGDRLSKLIREVNKCIAVLSDEKKK